VRHQTKTWKVEWLATGLVLLTAFGTPLGTSSLRSLGLNAGRTVPASFVQVASSSQRTGHVSLVTEQVIVPASTGVDPPPVQSPPWWSGPCDDNQYPNSFVLSSWDGLTACGPGPNRGGYDLTVGFFPGAWGELEWECVELSMRWLYLEYGVRPYPADGSQVVWNYSPADGGNLQKVSNDGSSVPRPGDVLSMGSMWGEEGHTAVVTGVNVNDGYGSINILEQNMNGGNGTNTLSVVANTVEPDYGMAVTGWLQAVTPPAVAALSALSTIPEADLVHDGGFNHQGPGAWRKTGKTRFGIEMVGALAKKPATEPYEGSGFAVTKNIASGGGIYQDVSFPVQAGDSFCADAQVVTVGADSGAKGAMSLWLLGDSKTQSAKARFGPLPGKDEWRPVSTCVTATGAHSDIRIQFYDIPGRVRLGIDAVDVHESFVENGGFEHHDAAGWYEAKHSWLGVESAGKLSTMPYGGNDFAVTNASAPTAGVYQDVSLPIRAGDSMCADAEVVTAGAHSGARGRMALWLLGKSKDQLSFVRFGRLPAKSHWTAVSTCVTATGPHSGFRIEFYDAPQAPPLGIDAVDVHQSFVENGGFNNGDSAGWHRVGRTWFGVEPAGKLDTTAYEGDDFGATDTSQLGGGIYQVVSLAIRAGESLCADAEVVTAGVRSGAAGRMALTLFGKAGSESSSVSFGPLRAKGQWTPVSTCVTASGRQSGFRIRFYDAPNTPTLGIDAVDVR
jgi:hypothetical protein